MLAAVGVRACQAIGRNRRRTITGVVWTLKGNHSNSYLTRASAFSTATMPVDEWIPPVYNPTGYVREIPRKSFGKKQMQAEYIARRMDESSIVIVVRGSTLKKPDQLVLRQKFREAGFRPNQLRAQGLVAAARYYSKYSDLDHIAGAESFGHGQLTLLMYRPPLVTLATTDRLKKLDAIIPLTNDKKTLDKHNKTPFHKFEIVGGYFLDKDKKTRNVWLDKGDMYELLTNLRKLADASVSAEDRAVLEGTYRAEDSNIEAHSFYLSEVTNVIRSHMGAIVPPLEQSLNVLPQTLQQSLNQVGNVFDSLVESKKKAETDDASKKDAKE